MPRNDTQAAARRAARAAVLQSPTLLRVILACAALRAADLAAAACVYRLWAQLAATDDAWRHVWRAQACSMRSLEPRIAAPAGAGFRAALAQLRASQLRTRVSWRLADYELGVDITYKGGPLFSGLASLALLEDAADGENIATLRLFNDLPDDTTDMALLQSDGRIHRHLALAVRTQRIQGELLLSVHVARSDGAMATLVAFQPASLADDAAASFYMAAWNQTQQQPLPLAAAVDNNTALAPISLDVVVMVRWEDADVPRADGAFMSCELTFYFSSDTLEMLGLEEEELGASTVEDALARLPAWVLPRGPAAAATALRLRGDEQHQAADEGEGEEDDAG